LISGAATGGNHDRGRNREAHRARARDDQDGYGRGDRLDQRRFGRHDPPDRRGGDRSRDHHRDEDARDAIGQALDRRLRSLGIAHQANDLRQYAGSAHRRGFDLERTGRVDGSADDAIAGLLLDRQRFAGQHRLVHGAGAAADDAVHGKSLAGADEHDIASTDVGDGNLFLAGITPNAGCGWLQGRQVAQRARRLPLRPRFQRVAQQHQRDDQDDRFVVDVGSRTLLLQRRRRDRGRKRVQERRAGPDRD
jgi:hypothetical protein